MAAKTKAKVKRADMGWLNSLLDMGDDLGVLLPGDADLVRSVFKPDGTVMASAPDSWKQPARFAAWAAVISTLAPQRLPVGRLMFLDGEHRETFKRIDAWTMHSVVMRGLNWFGQRDCQFNLWALDEPARITRQRFAELIERGTLITLTSRAF
jgi:hypothetical protein